MASRGDYTVGVPSTLPELLVTDFAGTTMKEEGAVLNAYRLALTEQGIPFTEDDLAQRRGASKRGVFRELAARRYQGERAEQAASAGLARFEAALRREYEAGEVREGRGA